MFARSFTLVCLTVAVAAIALSGCTPGGDPKPSDSSVAGETETPTPTSTATDEPAGPTFSLPSGCGTIASQATLNTVFSGVASRPANGLTRPSPASAVKALECSWFTGDTTGGDVIYYTVLAADSAAYLNVVTASGFACAAALDGTRCDKTTPNSQFPVDTVESIFTRDDVWIYVSMTNVPSDPLLPDMVATAWAA
ncbi:hypothetical protein BH11ACT3_BH11ACT3_09670 [soil metagenome]